MVGWCTRSPRMIEHTCNPIRPYNHLESRTSSALEHGLGVGVMSVKYPNGMEAYLSRGTDDNILGIQLKHSQVHGLQPPLRATRHASSYRDVPKPAIC